jgi:hypothetical protein
MIQEQREHMVNKRTPPESAVVTVTIKLTRKQRETLETMARTDRRSLSAFIRNVLEDFVTKESAAPQFFEQSRKKGKV